MRRRSSGDGNSTGCRFVIWHPSSRLLSVSPHVMPGSQSRKRAKPSKGLNCLLGRRTSSIRRSGRNASSSLRNFVRARLVDPCVSPYCHRTVSRMLNPCGLGRTMRPKRCRIERDQRTGLRPDRRHREMDLDPRRQSRHPVNRVTDGLRAARFVRDLRRFGSVCQRPRRRCARLQAHADAGLGDRKTGKSSRRRRAAFRQIVLAFLQTRKVQC
jgi:hypothetical protein